MKEKKIDDLELQVLLNESDKWLAPYRNGIAEGENRERERIISGIWDLEVPILTKGATFRDVEAMHYAIRLFRNAAIKMIKGENK